MDALSAAELIAVWERGREQPPVERALTLPDGREATVRLGLADDSYIPRREQETVVLELLVGGRHAAALDTVLDPNDEDDGAKVVREIGRKLEAGELDVLPREVVDAADRWPAAE